MFDRKKYKKFAKMQLKNRTTVPVLTTLLSLVIIALVSIPNAIDTSPSIQRLYYEQEAFSASLETVSWITTIIYDIVIATIFVAHTHIYLLMSKSPNPIRFSDFFEGFNHFFRAILTKLWTNLWICLWTLLFIIPGIVKSIAYSQVYFLITEFPKLGIRKALKISNIITRGYKGELFVMHLSFIGWNILGILTCGIAFLWIVPYQHLSYTNAYRALLKKAITTKLISIEDLVG